MDEKINILNTETPWNEVLSAKYKRSYSYIVVSQRLPRILSNIVEYLTLYEDDIIKQFGPEARPDLVYARFALILLKKSIEHDNPLLPFLAMDRDVPLWNNYIWQQQLQSLLGEPCWFHSCWLFVECYFYRSIHHVFQNTLSLGNLDPFTLAKMEELEKAKAKLISGAADLLSLFYEDLTEDDIHNHFIHFLKQSLWGNQYDLSKPDINTDPDSCEAHDKYILVNDSERVWETLKMVKEDKNIVDIVNDNAGYELFCDLCLADFILTFGLADSISLHFKAFPYFISDTIFSDFVHLMNILQESHEALLQDLYERNGTMREIIILLSLLGSAFVFCSPAGKVLHAKSGTEKPVGSVSRRFVRSVDLKAAKSSTVDSRLPRDVIPSGYKLQLQPFPEEGYFKGRVWINVTCQEPTASITLHAHEDLRIAHSEVRVKEITDFAPQDSTINNATKSTSVSLVVASTKKEPSKQWYVITLADSLKKEGVYQLDLSFAGDLATGFTQGFFRASYQLHRTREERWFAATKMSPSNARHVFPCFDEPDLKAPFEVSLAREEKMLALSNMPVQSRSTIENGGSWSWVHFQRSPPMSTFSVAVVVSDLEHLVANSTGSVTISVFARPTFLSQVQGVLEKAPRMLNFLERYLGVPFPLPKLDLVALPHYSDPDPADHWGLIILKESDFVNDDALAWRLADEMVQQWFGHLATPGWWTDASINKALANYMATLVSTEGKLNWNLLTGYSLYYEYSKRHPQTTQEEFLTITRIQWLLRMLNYTLTENTFRDGLRTFLQEKKLKTYNQSDLWEALTEQAHVDQTLVADINVEDIATSWITRERFPVVTVTRDYEDSSASVEQHMFLRERPNEHNDRDTLLWWVPLLYLSADNIDLNEQRPPVTWMHEEKHATLTNLPGSETFLIVNPEEIGMFMVNYDTHNWALLAEYLHGQGPSIPGVTRAKLLHDAWNLALGGELDVATALNLTVFLEDPKRETELPVWHAFFTMVDHLGHQVSGTPSGLKLEEYARIILTRLLDSLGSPQPDEDSDRTKLRLLVHDLLCPLGHTTCVQEAQQSFSKWMASEDPDAGNPVADLQLCTVFKWGTIEEWEFGMQRVIHFPTQRKQSERSYLLKTLAGCPRQPEKVERILNMTLLDDNGNWTDADVRLVLSMVTGSATGYNTLFNFLVQNWDEIKQKYDGKPHMWEYLIHRATEMFKTQEGLHMVSELYVKRQGEFGSAESVVEQSLRIINAEAQWSDQNLSSMEAWLDVRLSSLN